VSALAILRQLSFVPWPDFRIAEDTEGTEATDKTSGVLDSADMSSLVVVH
jgi:hypothetical protein